MRPSALSLLLLLAALPARAGEKRPGPREPAAQVRLLGWTKDSKFAVFSVDRHPQPGRSATAPRLVVLDREGKHQNVFDDDLCPKDAPASRDCIEGERGGKAAWLKKTPLASAAEPVAFTDTLTAAGTTVKLQRDASGCTLRVTREKLSGPLFSGPCPETSTLQLVASPDGRSVAAAWTTLWPESAKCPENEPCVRSDGHFGIVTRRAVTPVALLMPDGDAYVSNAKGEESLLLDRGWLQVTVGELKDAHEGTEIFVQKGYEPLAKELAAILATDLWDQMISSEPPDVAVKPLTWKSAQPIVIAIAGEGHGREAK